MIHAALSSSALIGSSIDHVLETAAAVGVKGVEWTDDGFVAPGDLGSASDAMMSTLHAGLCTVAYSSLYRAGIHDRAAFDRALDTTRALNAPILRLWSAPAGPAPDDAAADFIDEARSLGDQAGRFGVTLCFGLAPHTVLDSYGRAAELLSTIDNPFVTLAWEPFYDARFDDAMDSFTAIAGYISLISVRYAEAGCAARRLGERSEEWLQYLDAFDEQGGSPDMARHVVFHAFGNGDRALLADDVKAVTEWSVALRRYHKRRVF